MIDRDEILFLKKYQIASEFVSPLIDLYDYETISKMCLAIMEAAALKEELSIDNNGNIKITIHQALAKMEIIQFDAIPALKKRIKDLEEKNK